MAASTRAAVTGRTPRSPFTTRETVLTLTPAMLATYRMVGLATSGTATPHPLTTMSGREWRTLILPDNVVNSRGPAGCDHAPGAGCQRAVIRCPVGEPSRLITGRPALAGRRRPPARLLAPGSLHRPWPSPRSPRRWQGR